MAGGDSRAGEEGQSALWPSVWSGHTGHSCTITCCKTEVTITGPPSCVNYILTRKTERKLANN